MPNQPNSEFEKKLEQVQPRKLADNEREYMWMQVEDSILHPKKAWARFLAPLTKRTKLSAKKLVLVPVLILALLTGSLTTAFAFADDSLPGDFFFPADITAEKILLTLSFGDTEDELRLQFAEERLDEVRALLALASSIEGNFATGTATSTDDVSDDSATSTDDGSDDDTTSTSTDNGSDDDSSSNDDEDDSGGTDESSDDDDTDTEETNENGVDPIEEEFLNGFDFDVDTVNDALLFALAQLEESRAVFASEGNANGVVAINSFINDLNNLALNHVEKLDRVSVVVKDDGDDKVKIQIVASSQELKTQFSFTEKTDKDGSTTQSIVFKDEDSRSTLKSDDDGKFDFNFLFKRNKKDDDDDDKDDKKDKDDDDDGDDKDDKKDKKDKDDDKDDKKSSNKVLVCHKDKNTLSISKNARWAHIFHGDSLGACSGDQDDDDGDDDDGDDDDDNDDTTEPVITNKIADPAITTAKITWTTDEEATSKIWYSTESPVVESSPTPLMNDNTLLLEHEVILTNLSASTTYFYVVISKDAEGNSASAGEMSFTTQAEPEPGDTTAPEISNISAAPTTTAANILWDTNEDADSTVFYDGVSPVDTDTAMSETDTSLETDHNVPLSGLTAETTYFYIVVSVDGSGNTATSSQSSFDTTAEPVVEPPADTDAPVISNIAADATTTEATVSWDTDEDADSTVLFSTVSPVDPNTATKVTSSTLETDHELTLLSLTASTTYFYVVVSTDEAGNTATSSEESFVTDLEPAIVPPADETAPEISHISVFDVASTTAAISWDTDEDADGRIWYSIDNPVVAGPLTPMVEHLDFKTDHTHFLGGLSASTTYQYIIVSTDEAGNAATSTQDSFATAGE